jgi:hypothetical protein
MRMMGNQDDHSWVVAVAYVIAAATAFLASGCSRDRGRRSFWAVSAVTLLAFGVAKNYRIPGVAMNLIRAEARTYHLYDYRKIAEYPFVVVVIGAALFIGWRARNWLSAAGRGLMLPALGWLGFVAFLLIRAASLHAIDPLMYRPVLGLSFGGWVELMFLLAIAAAALASVAERNAS